MRLLVLWALLAWNVSSYAREIEILQDRQKILSEARSDAQVIGELNKGQTIPCRNRVGMYWEVLVKEDLWGFLSIANVRLTGAHGAQFNDPTQNHKLSVIAALNRTRPAASASRGAQKESNFEKISNYPPNFRLIYLMESLRVPRPVLNLFDSDLNVEILEKLHSK